MKDITFLFTDLKGSTDMYDQIGDLKAYFLVWQHFDTLITAIGRERDLHKPRRPRFPGS